MKRNGLQTIFGAALILLGGLLLLEKFGFLKGSAAMFWGVVLLVGAGYFLYVFVQSPQGRWWAIIPGMALLGMAGSELMPKAFEWLSGGLFLGAMGLAFIIVYLTDRAKWWGIIPGGVLITLAVVASLEKSDLANNGSLFFVGLGLTFLLVAVLPNPAGTLQWAYIPAVVLLLMGALLGTQISAGLADYIWPAALIIAGLVVVLSFFLKQKPAP